jgi:hypothetical protein
MSHGRFHWLRACAGGTLALLFACVGAHAQQAGTPATLPPTVEPAVPSGAPADPAPCTPAACDPATSVWSKVPPPVTFPRLGAFFILPTGPGYYSLKDVLTDNYREKPPVYPWPPFTLDVVPFYDNNFRYLDNPDNTQKDWLDPLKRIHLGENWLLSFGGEERIRFNDELDSRLSGKNNIFTSERTRVYGDLWYRDLFRAYVEFEDVQAFSEELPPSPTDINKSDLLNFFIDLKIFELDGHAAYLRGGRQELNYGSQRLISQTDFPNSPRNFDGVKGFWHSDTWEVDAFWTRPVVINPDDFDSENDKETFAGVWTKYKPTKNQSLDLYYLYLDNATPIAGAPAGSRGGFDVNTFGARYAGDQNLLVWDFEGMYQFGQHTFQTTSAGAATAGAGFHFADLPMNPIFWVYYDFASGSHDPGHGEYGTFNQLFPNGHNYFGWTDLVGRQNIEDLNFQAWFFPTKWITAGVQYHILRLDSAKDALFNAAGAVERVDPTGKAGTDVGNVVTGVVNFHLSMHSDLELQYSRFDSGSFIKSTGSPLSPDLFYLQYTFRW